MNITNPFYYGIVYMQRRFTAACWHRIGFFIWAVANQLKAFENVYASERYLTNLN